jgi:hypothetical protein
VLIVGRGILEGSILTERGGISLNTDDEGLDEDNIAIIQG